MTSVGEIEVTKTRKKDNERTIKSECDCITLPDERHRQFDDDNYDGDGSDPLAAALMDILSEPAFRQKICEGLQQQQQQSQNGPVIVENS